MKLSDDLEEIESFDVRHLPIFRACLEKLNVVDIIDRCLECNMQFSPGRIVLGLVLDVLTGRTPLFRVMDFFEHQDIELVVGEDLPLQAFNDDNIGRVLDRLFDYGTMKIFSEISIQAVKSFHLNTKVVHEDTTSVSVWGEYAYSKFSKGITLTQGFSKDHRPDLKQFIFSLLSIEKTIPIFGKLEDGNESDKTINKNILSHVAEYMAKHGVCKNGFIYVADSALVTNENLKILGALNQEENIQFISRMPETYKECLRVIKDATQADSWITIGKLSSEASRHNRPTAEYKSYESKVTIDGKEYRAIVIHSDVLDKRRQKKIARRLKRDKTEIEKACKELERLEFQSEQNAETFIEILPEGRYHKLEWGIEKQEIYKRGRPKKGKKREVARIYYKLKVKVIPDGKLIENLREEAGCFVLLKNIPQRE